MNEAKRTSRETSSLNARARSFLAARGLDPELCERLGLVSVQDRAGTEGIVFPYEREGLQVNRKFRALDQKTFRQDKGGEQILWRYDCIADEALADEPLIITEGEFDAVATIQAGYWRTVSVPIGAPALAADGEVRSGKYAAIEHAYTAMNNTKRIIIASDADGPGAAMLSDLTNLLGAARCQFVTYPRGCKDLNDVLKAHGEDAVRECIDGARWVRVAGVYKIREMAPLPPLEVWRPDVLQPIDDLIPICPMQVSVWTGIPGHGKSSLLNAISWSLARRDGVKIAHGTFEATPQRDYLDDCIGFLTGLPAYKATHEEREQVTDWVNEQVTFLVADGFAGPGQEEFFDATLDWFFEAAKTAVARDGCRIVILDPWSQIEHVLDGRESETAYIQKSIRRAKMFARAFNVHVAIVAHPTKMRKLDDGTYAMPEGYEISGSAHWFNGVDMGVTSHRDPPSVPEKDEDGETTGEWAPDPSSTRVRIRVWKKKNHRIMGKPGDAYASFDSNTNRYSSAEHWEDRSYPKRYPEAKSHEHE